MGNLRRRPAELTDTPVYLFAPPPAGLVQAPPRPVVQPRTPAEIDALGLVVGLRNPRPVGRADFPSEPLVCGD